MPASARPMQSASDLVSPWKNERKNRLSRALRGGYRRPDALYDSQL